ncbi:MAG TPA: response regulator transcription factor [Candidatus Acidoferrales bacterium]|nr:response regulator transcription factor [Candidatus Acidoferrales bacterium]
MRANSAAELAELEAVVRSRPALKLAGSSLGPPRRAVAGGKLAEAQVDVLLEHAGEEDLKEFASLDADVSAVPRVWLVDEPEFGAAVALAQAMESGVHAVLPAWAADAEIHAAIEAAANGLRVFHPEVVDYAAAPAANPARAAPAASGQSLSPRESEILNLLAAGLGNKEIASRLQISEHTVKFHVTSIFNKLGASTRAEAVAIGMRRGLILL